MIVFSHIRNTGNTGDMASCPAPYFVFPEYKVLNYAEPLPAETTAVIYGGGTMTNWLRTDRRFLTVRKTIGWGIGSSLHTRQEPWSDPPLHLIGTREWTAEREAAGLWVPCASCMSPLFDLDYPIEREDGVFINADMIISKRYPVRAGGQVMANDQPMDKIVRFLGTSRTIHTNSYHGAYWGALLGRAVVATRYSSKFYQMPEGPDLLNRCRLRNRAFYERVREMIG